MALGKISLREKIFSKHHAQNINEFKITFKKLISNKLKKKKINENC